MAVTTIAPIMPGRNLILVRGQSNTISHNIATLQQVQKGKDQKTTLCVKDLEHCSTYHSHASKTNPEQAFVLRSPSFTNNTHLTPPAPAVLKQKDFKLFPTPNIMHRERSVAPFHSVVSVEVQYVAKLACHITMVMLLLSRSKS